MSKARPYVKVATSFPNHPKVLAIGPLGEALWLRGLCYAGEQMTDGFIPASFVRRMGDIPEAAALAETLVTVGLWAEADGGYTIHGYLTWQTSRDHIEQVSATRKAAGKLGGRPPKAIGNQTGTKPEPKENQNGYQSGNQNENKTKADDNPEVEVKVKTSASPTDSPGATAPAAPEPIVSADDPPKTEPPAPEEKPEWVPRDNDHERLIEWWAKHSGAGLPVAFKKALGSAKRLVEAGITIENAEGLYAYCERWQDGTTLDRMYGAVDSYRVYLANQMQGRPAAGRRMSAPTNDRSEMSKEDADAAFFGGKKR